MEEVKSRKLQSARLARPGMKLTSKEDDVCFGLVADWWNDEMDPDKSWALVRVPGHDGLFVVRIQQKSAGDYHATCGFLCHQGAACGAPCTLCLRRQVGGQGVCSKCARYCCNHLALCGIHPDALTLLEVDDSVVLGPQPDSYAEGISATHATIKPRRELADANDKANAMAQQQSTAAGSTRGKKRKQPDRDAACDAGSAASGGSCAQPASQSKSQRSRSRKAAPAGTQAPPQAAAARDVAPARAAIASEATAAALAVGQDGTTAALPAARAPAVMTAHTPAASRGTGAGSAGALAMQSRTGAADSSPAAFAPALAAAATLAQAVQPAAHARDAAPAPSSSASGAAVGACLLAACDVQAESSGARSSKRQRAPSRKAIAALEASDSPPARKEPTTMDDKQEVAAGDADALFDAPKRRRQGAGKRTQCTMQPGDTGASKKLDLLVPNLPVYVHPQARAGPRYHTVELDRAVDVDCPAQIQRCRLQRMHGLCTALLLDTARCFHRSPMRRGAIHCKFRRRQKHARSRIS